MKEFSLEEYLKNPNREVVTRDGRNVRIICTDRKNHDSHPIIALVETDEDDERVRSFKIDGKWSVDGLESNFDLFFAPTIVKRWGIVYRKAERLFDTREEAEEWMEEADEGEKKFCSVCKVEWEEE